MKVAIIGRTEILYDTARLLHTHGHEVVCVLTAKEAPEYTRTARDFAKLANEWQVPFAQGPRIAEYMGFMHASGADIGVSINYTGVVPQEVIDLFPLGILNAHGGDLPRYRGNACQAWAILNGESRIGLCIHRMVGGELDSGDIVAREYMDIDTRTKVGDTWLWMTERTPHLMLEAVNSLIKDPQFVIERQSVDPADALRCYPRTPDDGRIQWDEPAIQVLRLINASGRPYAGAFCLLEGERFVVWEAELGDMQERFLAVPGQITRIGSDYVEVACREGMVRLTQVELRGEAAAPSRFIRSLRTRLT